MILEVNYINKSLPSPDGTIVKILSNVTFNIQDNSIAALVGPSGSGKTTLLGLCAGLDLPDSGSILFQGSDITKLSENERTILRRTEMGFVFQNFQLIPNLSALDNVMLPLELGGKVEYEQSIELARKALHQVELQHRSHHYPHQLSGGEQQRVSIARSIVHKPKLLFADEPTGNLDTKTGEMIQELLFSLHREYKMTTILVTHDLDFASKAERVLQIKGGEING